MACVALTSLMATIQLEFLQPIPRVPLHDEAPIKSFFEKLSSLQAFLQEESSSGGAAIKDLDNKIRDFALKAEDDIEYQLSNFLLARDNEYQERASQELHQTLREVAENAAELLMIINSTSNEADETNKTQPSTRWLKHASESMNVKWNGSLQSSLKLQDRMVGRSYDCKVIMDQLFYPRYEVTLISIVGMVGIGKTTLAGSVYGDPSVASHFEVRGWITMPQEYNESTNPVDLFCSVTLAEPNEIKKGSTPYEVYKYLLKHRYLIVLDNLWSKLAWDDIQRCLPNNEKGSRILLTTRHFGWHYYHSPCYYMHNMTLLNPDRSWELFCNILSAKAYTAPSFEKIRSHVVEKCEGLPQSIVVVAERLSKCNNIEQEWKRIEKELESLGFLDRSALTRIYNQLPQYLKTCFVYLGVFPKRNKIVVKKLIRLWIAEGFLNPLEHQEVETQASGYLQELINRSLVLIDNRSSDGKIKTCRIHSALHNFCVGEAQKEGILCAVNIRQFPRGSLNAFENSCRWLSLYTHSFDYYVLFSTNNPRSIFFFHENPEIFIPLNKLLRVLASVPPPFFKRMQRQDLVFLRYLSITQWVEGFNDVVSTNLNLQTLDVFGSETQLGAPTLHLPSKIWELPKLRHLELGNLYTVDPPSMVKENLQSLSWVRPVQCRKEVYHRLPNIKKLKLFLKDDLEPSLTCGSCSNPIILENLGYLERLEKLTISVSVGCAITLPTQHMFPSQLKKLRLSGINLSEWDLTVIGMLPQLVVFKLENAFHGKVWEVAEGGFRRLKFLLLEAKKLEQLIFDKVSFRWLEHLVLRFCYCLKEIPRDFGSIRTMQSIELDRCGTSLVASVKQIQYMFNKIEIKIQDSHMEDIEILQDNVAVTMKRRHFTTHRSCYSRISRCDKKSDNDGIAY